MTNDAPSPETLLRGHHWTPGGSCTECGCLYVGFDRVDPCPGKASSETKSVMARLQTISSVRDCLGDDFQSLDAAKAVAQADYDRRITSTLTAPPQTREVGK